MSHEISEKFQHSFIAIFHEIFQAKDPRSFTTLTTVQYAGKCCVIATIRATRRNILIANTEPCWLKL